MLLILSKKAFTRVVEPLPKLWESMSTPYVVECQERLLERTAPSTRRKSKKLEEEVLIKYILDLDARGYPLSFVDVAEMANSLIYKDEIVQNNGNPATGSGLQ